MVSGLTLKSSPAKAKLCACVSCGGSGVLRQGRDTYRTCLPCLGKGFLLPNKIKASPVFAAR
jgi:DnaJ-class molecular chaperone